MKLLRNLPAAIAGIVLLFVIPARAETKMVSVLTIGNSFAENALKHLPEIVKAQGHTLIVGRANLGGCTLERHWRHVSEFEKDPGSKEGSPYGNGKRSLDEMLKSRTWDYVTVQQVSTRSHDRSTYYPFGPDLIAYIRERAPDTTILVHQIWAYRVDDPRFTPINEGKLPHTQQLMYQKVRSAYHDFAKKLDLGIMPSGDAMHLADTDPKMGYQPDPDFDFTNATPPAKPKQIHSLHTGWHWKKDNKGNSTLKMDGHHANNAGEYLLGCVWFENLFGESVIENSYAPKGIDPEFAKFLRKTAHRAVAAQKTE